MRKTQKEPLENNCHKILLIDDDEALLNAMHAILRKEGYSVRLAKDGEMAKEFIETAHFDAIVSDIRLGSVSGVELLQYIRRCAGPVPVVLMTGYLQVMEAKEAELIGAAGFLTKPFQTADLVAMLKKILSAPQGRKLA
jgi:DNA-binding NtrC family response regulator